MGLIMKRFDVGDRVVEPTYGHGNVVSVEDDYMRIEFDEHGTKKFLISLAKLERSTEPGARVIGPIGDRVSPSVFVPART